ncbi:hypothetical protein D3Z60_24185 [Lachnospiraceae bacterium]|nr:hypothetical protein [Lachnospiraceae bacterium]
MIKIVIEKKEVDEMISMQELYDAYETLACILSSKSEVKDEFKFTDSQKEMMKKEYNVAYEEIAKWWNNICEKYELDNTLIEKFYLNYNTNTIQYDN